MGALHTGGSLEEEGPGDFLSDSSSPSELLVVKKVANPQDLLSMGALVGREFRWEQPMFGISAREWLWREERICVETNRLVGDLESGFCMNRAGFSSSRFSSSGNRPAYPWGF